jgi:hypothetical protein
LQQTINVPRVREAIKVLLISKTYSLTVMSIIGILAHLTIPSRADLPRQAFIRCTCMPLNILNGVEITSDVFGMASPAMGE